MMHVIKVICFGAIVSSMVVGCVPVKDPGRTGFLSDYSKLEEIEENHLVYDSGNSGNYSKFIIEPVAMLYRQAEKSRYSPMRNSRISRHTSQARCAKR